MEALPVIQMQFAVVLCYLTLRAESLHNDLRAVANAYEAHVLPKARSLLVVAKAGLSIGCKRVKQQLGVDNHPIPANIRAKGPPRRVGLIPTPIVVPELEQRAVSCQVVYDGVSPSTQAAPSESAASAESTTSEEISASDDTRSSRASDDSCSGALHDTETEAKRIDDSDYEKSKSD